MTSSLSIPSSPTLIPDEAFRQVLLDFKEKANPNAPVKPTILFEALYLNPWDSKVSRYIDAKGRLVETWDSREHFAWFNLDPLNPPRFLRDPLTGSVYHCVKVDLKTRRLLFLNHPSLYCGDRDHLRKISLMWCPVCKIRIDSWPCPIFLHLQRQITYNQPLNLRTQPQEIQDAWDGFASCCIAHINSTYIPYESHLLLPRENAATNAARLCSPS